MDQTGRKKILIADDEQDLREILKMILSAEGYEVVEAENGLQAARLADESIDMYILDVNMPENPGPLSGAASVSHSLLRRSRQGKRLFNRSR